MNNKDIVLDFGDNYYEQFDIAFHLKFNLNQDNSFQSVRHYVLSKCRNCYIDSKKCKHCCLHKMYERFDKERLFSKYIYKCLKEYGNVYISQKSTKLSTEQIKDLERMGFENARIETSENGNNILKADKIKDYKY